MRLIDADNIISDICTYCNQEACDGGMAGSRQECETIRMIRDVIDDTPIVYDVDKVVEELEELKGYTIRNGVMGITTVKKAINIVKAGGKNDQ